MKEFKPLPCPFCGKNHYFINGRGKTYFVVCQNKRCGGEGPSKSSRKRAVIGWNRRTKT